MQQFFNIFTPGIALALALSGAPDSVLAAPKDAFGLDAQSSAQAMAITASATPHAAAASNPARLIDTRNIEASLDLAVSDDQLKINRIDADLDTYVGYQFGLAANLPLGVYRDRLFLGISAHLPHQGLYDVQNTAAQTPVVLENGSNARRFSLDAALAVRIWERIALGIGFHLMPDVTANVNIDLTSQNDASSSSVNVGFKAAPTVGIYAEPIPGLHLGLSYRAATRLDLNVPANVIVSSAIDDIHVQLLGYAYAEPHELNLGIRYDFAELAPSPLARFAADLDLQYRHFVHPIATSARVTLFDENGDPLQEPTTKLADFNDAWAIRMALTWTPLDEVSATVGYAFQKSPVPAQRNAYNVLDSDTNLFSFGTTLWLPEQYLSSFGLGFSTSAQFNFRTTRNMEKYEFLVGNPGFPSIRFEGFHFTWHASILLRFE